MASDCLGALALQLLQSFLAARGSVPWSRQSVDFCKILKRRKGTLPLPAPVRKGVRSESNRKRKDALALTQVWDNVQEQNDRRRNVLPAIMQVGQNVEPEESAGIKNRCVVGHRFR